MRQELALTVAKVSDYAPSMKFAVQLTNGAKPLMENVTDCFQGDFARIRKMGDDSYLESSLFDACTAPVEVFPIADNLIRLMHRFTALHGRLFLFSEVGYVQEFSDAGAPFVEHYAQRQGFRFTLWRGFKNYRSCNAVSRSVPLSLQRQQPIRNCKKRWL